MFHAVPCTRVKVGLECLQAHQLTYIVWVWSLSDSSEKLQTILDDPVSLSISHLIAGRSI